jgi:hypothetical protein
MRQYLNCQLTCQRTNQTCTYDDLTHGPNSPH